MTSMIDDTNPCDLCATLEDKALHTILTAHGGTWMCPACATVFEVAEQ